MGGGRGGELYAVVTGSLAIQPKGNLGCGSMEIVGRAGGEVCRAGWVDKGLGAKSPDEKGERGTMWCGRASRQRPKCARRAAAAEAGEEHNTLRSEAVGGGRGRG